MLSFSGKTHISEAMANCAGGTFYSVKAKDIGCKWSGQSEKKVSLLFEEAKKQDYSIIFIDEIDGVCSNRDGNPDEHDRKVLTSFLTEINSIGQEGSSNVAVIAATNVPWDLDCALLDRFDTKIYVPLPDLETRKSILELQMNKYENSLNDVDFQHLARLMEGATARQIKSLVNMAVKQACHGSAYLEVDGQYTPVLPCESCPEYQKGVGICESCICHCCGAVRISLYDLPCGSGTLKPRSVNLRDFSQHLKASYNSADNNLKQKYEEWQGN